MRSLNDLLRPLMPFVSRSGRLDPGMEVTSRLIEKAGDYQVLVGRSFLLTHEPSDARHLAVWLSWQAERTGAGIRSPLASLEAALKAIGLPSRPHDQTASFDPDFPNIEYFICRDLGNSILRGRGKMSIAEEVIERLYPTKRSQPPVAKFATALESAWRAQIQENRETARMTDVTVSWQEYWLGHWGSF